ncbi:type VI secretion system-associated FHA domain protein TagH [Neptunicoccus sediminis]|uniref:type VI secretion system-associated FHA domain protein TagH n=1 Tax=Neptunicoccus sediminis TaxID=1892596 RepID=UPI0008460772|nr:type VI secretion system-associated FHA domain protein TagH [Neptunicoccus sediminis]
MTLTLQILSSGAQPGRETAFPLVGGALTIGRSETNNVVLPDPTREISSSHAVVQERGGDYVIVDTSTNGTFLNGESAPLGDFPTPLNDGDVLRIGSYEMQVVIVTATASADPFGDLPPPLGEEPIVEDTAPTLDTLAEVGSLDTDGGDFLDDLLGEAPPNAMDMKTPDLSDDPDNTIDDFLDVAPNPDREGGASVPDHSGPGQDFFRSNSTAQAIPDNWEDDLQGATPEPMGGPPNAAAPSQPAPAGGGLIPETTFSSEPFSIPEPDRAEQPAKSDSSDPIDELLGTPPEPVPAKPAAAPAPQPAAQPEPPAPQPAAQAEAPPPHPSSASDHALARQFLGAAGVDHSRISDEELGPIMERTGIAFRTLVEGAREVLMARASIKDELRLGQTTISPDGNNPIKFSISGQQAVEAMIKPTVAGYQSADKAAAEAMMDIKAHEVAMMSGMESAIKTLLARFDPAELATRIEDSGRLGGLLKGKKAQYWDVFEKLYKQLSEDAEEDFNTLFGKEFAKAYKDQLQKLKSD